MHSVHTMRAYGVLETSDCIWSGCLGGWAFAGCLVKAIGGIGGKYQSLSHGFGMLDEYLALIVHRVPQLYRVHRLRPP